jgi:septal ring factor EnvC (AmiA/AmiB activator)
MKTILLLMLVALICGCKPDARLAQHQTEIAALQAELATVKQRQAEQTQDFQDLLAAMETYNGKMTTNMAAMMKLLPHLLAQNSYITNSIPEMIAAAKPKPVAAPIYNAQKKAQPKVLNRYGVPDSVYQTIYAEAVKQWPDNYEMQEYRIKNQAEAWKQLHR